MVQSITIYRGRDKHGNWENLEMLNIKKGEIVGIVGPTGSGKSSLISDIELLAQGETPTGRVIHLNDAVPAEELRKNTQKKVIAQLSQNMNFFANMSVREFLLLHAKCRLASKNKIEKVVKLANTLTGEPIELDDELTMLSGGQSRSLMIADIAIISDSPVVLIDEIENAGIKKYEALKVLAGHGKIVLVVTHDPVLALLTNKRIIMKHGGMQRVIDTTDKEREIVSKLNVIDMNILSLRERVRNGESIESAELYA